MLGRYAVEEDHRQDGDEQGIDEINLPNEGQKEKKEEGKEGFTEFLEAWS
jgi:hypothetical protein